MVRRHAVTSTQGVDASRCGLAWLVAYDRPMSMRDSTASGKNFLRTYARLSTRPSLVSRLPDTCEVWVFAHVRRLLWRWARPGTLRVQYARR